MQLDMENECCGNCKYYNECIITWNQTILSQTMEMKDCVCSNWKNGENEIQISLFEELI